MKALKHLPSIAFFIGAIVFMLWFFRFSIASYDLRPWLIGFLCVSALLGFGAGAAGSRMVPLPYRGVVTGIIAVGLGVFVFLAVGWPLAEMVTSELREARGFQSDLGTTYFYHDFSGSGTGNLFNFYSQTLVNAFVAAAVCLVAALFLSPLFGLPYLIAKPKEA